MTRKMGKANEQLNKQLKVLFITSAYPTSSHPFLGQFVKDLQDSLVQQFNIEIVVVALRTPKSFVKRIFHLLKLYIISRKAVKRYKPDLIHAHWLLPNGFVSTLFKVPSIATVYGASIFVVSKNILARKMIDFTLKRIKNIVCISTYTQKRLAAITNVPSKIIPFGPGRELTKKILSRSQEFNKEREKTILMVGNLIPRKGHIYGLKAFKLLKKKYPDLKMIIVGSGPLEVQLRKYIADNNLEDSVLIKSMLSSEELHNLMSSSKMLLHPAIIDKNGDTEGLGLVLIEAILCKTPVIASSVGGITDIVIDNKTGLLVEEKNVKQIAEKIEYILNRPKIGTEFYNNFVKNLLHKFQYDNIAKEYYSLYVETIQKDQIINK